MSFARKYFWLVMTIGSVAAIGPGRIEGRLLPAAEPATILTVVQHPDLDDYSIVSGSSERLRPNCSPREMKWYLGDRDGRDAPAEVDWGKPIKRADGVFEFYDWLVQVVPEEALRNQSYADVMHRCKYFGLPSPWLTRSRFYR
jgi:hypothetical protein